MSGGNDTLSNLNIDKTIPTDKAFSGMKGFESTTPTVGSSNFDSLLKDPMFMKYISDMGAGMMNKPTFSQSMSSGLSSASSGMSDFMKRKETSDLQNKLSDEQMRMIMTLFNKSLGK
jgi:hypothetical protein